MGWRAYIGRWGGATIPGEAWMRATFVLLLGLAALLRFWDYGSLPYMHDEISALNRLYPSLWETISHGVMAVDTHPPGVQVFEWLWTRAFGVGSMAVKLPFTIAALLALVLIHRTAMAWTSPAAALVLAAYLAVAQYFVMYAQIARPYAMGLLTTAWLADRLTRYLATGRSGYLGWAVVAAVLSAYVHHFSMMLAAIMMLSGLFLAPREQRRHYLLACGAGILAYLPNLPIFLHQLSLGGLAEWLAPPDRYWLTDHMRWLAHDSRLFALVLALIGLVALRGLVSTRALPGPSNWMLPLWGLLPMVVGLAYSVWINPVVQYSMLIFSFPYLAMVFFSGLHGIARNRVLAACALVAVVGTWSLVEVRRHYSDFYTGNYDNMVATARELWKAHGADGLVVAFDAADEAIRYQRRLHGLGEDDLPYVQLRGVRSHAVLDSVLGRLDTRMLLLGIANNGNTEHVARAQQVLPHLLGRMDLPEAQLFLFATQPCPNAVNDRTPIASLTPEATFGETWHLAADLPMRRDSLGGPIGWELRNREFGVGCEIRIDEAARDPYDMFEVVLDLHLDKPGADVGLVVELFGPQGRHLYRTNEAAQLGRAGDASLAVAAFTALAPRGTHDLRIKAYVHVRDGSKVIVRGMHVYRRDADPLLHTLFGRMRPQARMDWTAANLRKSGRSFAGGCLP